MTRKPKEKHLTEGLDCLLTKEEKDWVMQQKIGQGSYIRALIHADMDRKKIEEISGTANKDEQTGRILVSMQREIDGLKNKFDSLNVENAFLRQSP